MESSALRRKEEGRKEGKKEGRKGRGKEEDRKERERKGWGNKSLLFPEARDGKSFFLVGSGMN